jgi:hypothetical protein
VTDINDFIDDVCSFIVTVTEGRLSLSDLGPHTEVWSFDGVSSVGLDSIEIIALLYRLDEASGRPLSASLELRPSVTVSDIAALLACVSR